MRINTLKITGSDADTFLQGQVTCDIDTLSEKALLTACCNQKGRMVANFWIWKFGNDFFLSLPKPMTDVLLTHLKKYAIFSKVTMEIANDTSPAAPNDDTLIWILPETTEQFTPQMINLQWHGGVSFTKGCYLGQEIIARTEHLGQLKRHLYQATVNKKIDAQVGDEIFNEKKQKMGVVVAVIGSSYFAVIEDRAVESPLYLKGEGLDIRRV